MPKITNKRYRQFLDEGIITPLTEQNIRAALNNIKGKYAREGKALLITLYYTGARPNEVLNLTGKDVLKEDSYIVIKMPRSKLGLPRPIYLPYRKELARIVYNYSMGVFPDMFLFFNYRSSCKRIVKGKEYSELAHNIRYHFRKWFKGVIDGGITPYFLRHSRFSNLSLKGVDLKEIQQLKGGKTMASVHPYIHLSTKSAKAIAKKLD